MTTNKAAAVVSEEQVKAALNAQPFGASDNDPTRVYEFLPYDTAVEIMTSALQAAFGVGGWRPIEEAPKDGTRVLLASVGGAVWLGNWRSNDVTPYESGWTRYNCVDRGWNPDSFQPLPPPPASEEG